MGHHINVLGVKRVQVAFVRLDIGQGFLQELEGEGLVAGFVVVPIIELSQS